MKQVQPQTSHLKHRALLFSKRSLRRLCVMKPCYFSCFHASLFLFFFEMRGCTKGLLVPAWVVKINWSSILYFPLSQTPSCYGDKYISTPAKWGSWSVAVQGFILCVSFTAFDITLSKGSFVAKYNNIAFTPRAGLSLCTYVCSSIVSILKLLFMANGKRERWILIKNRANIINDEKWFVSDWRLQSFQACFLKIFLDIGQTCDQFNKFTTLQWRRRWDPGDGGQAIIASFFPVSRPNTDGPIKAGSTTLSEMRRALLAWPFNEFQKICEKSVRNQWRATSSWEQICPPEDKDT